jgi:hypothetical protein
VQCTVWGGVRHGSTVEHGVADLVRKKNRGGVQATWARMGWPAGLT